MWSDGRKFEHGTTFPSIDKHVSALYDVKSTLLIYVPPFGHQASAWAVDGGFRPCEYIPYPLPRVSCLIVRT